MPAIRRGPLLAGAATALLMALATLLFAPVLAAGEVFGQTVSGAPPASWVAAVVGGLAIGYGARLSYGCNIGAFFSGVASTSLHGWVWIVAALLGSSIGVRLRPRFGLRNEAPARGVVDN